MVMERLQRIIDWLRDRGRRITAQTWAAARDPLRLLTIVAVGALLLIGLPYTATGLSRVGRAAMDWRSESRVHWHHADGVVTGVRDSDGLVARVKYRDDDDRSHVAETRVGDTGSQWLATDVRVKFDPKHPSRIEILGFRNRSPVAGLLIAGAPLGAGIGALIVAVGVWRRRRLVAVSASPIAALRRPLNLGGAVVVAGVGAWAAGTVLDRGWSAVATSTGHLAGTVFGDLLGVLVPVVAFVFGALLTAWLARHRHHGEHDGLLSSAHRLIDRAAGMVPSPEELAPDESASERDAPSPPPNPEPTSPVRAG
ncbi:MAG: hypothetical protein ABIP21_06465 [Acidimicrobiia bacterium]